ncbi:MAG: YdcF family protein [Clostridia bacterium]|nr:YdcF family protein [Clostridia bacterium]
MKMSELTPEVVQRLTPEQKWEICCSGIRDEGESAETALLLGSRPDRAVERALAAAELYRQGRVRTIIPTGGPKWEYRGELLSEAEIMSLVLRKNGVPDEAIVPENEARTTAENMICGTLQMLRHYHRIPDSVIIVTSVTHMKRSMALAKALLPRKIRASMYPSYPAMDRDEWLRLEDSRTHLDDSIRYHRELIENGDTEDFEVELQ